VFKRLLIVDPSLVDVAGHHFEYDRATSEAASRKGMEVVVAANRKAFARVRSSMDVLPVFRMGMYDRRIHAERFSSLTKKLNTILFIGLFLLDWRKMRRLTAVTPATLVFFPTCAEGTVFGLLLWLAVRARENRPKVVCLFRYDPRFLMGFVTRFMRRFVEQGALVLVTDSELLSQDYERMTGVKFDVVPIPHVPVISSGRVGPAPRGEAPKFVYLGDARIDKGLHILLGAIELLGNEIGQGKLEFIIQSAMFRPVDGIEDVVRRLNEIGERTPGGVVLIGKPLESKEYYELLESAGAVVVPYLMETYRSRTSGVLTEALGAGKPVIVTENTWMAAQVSKYGAGATFRSGSPEDLAKAILAVAENFENLRVDAQAKKDAWNAVHNADRLIETVLSLSGA
jgi:glycosyltransferase involved in cell wall biosynthesis